MHLADHLPIWLSGELLYRRHIGEHTQGIFEALQYCRVFLSNGLQQLTYVRQNAIILDGIIGAPVTVTMRIASMMGYGDSLTTGRHVDRINLMHGTPAPHERGS